MIAADGHDADAHLDDARCADLVLGLVPEGERAAALGHIASCPACEARLRAHVGAAERARAERPSPRRAAAGRALAAWLRLRGPSLGLAAAAALVIAWRRAPRHRAGGHDAADRR